jgi:hypothetical protein
VNGREIFRNDCARGATPSQDSVMLKLRKGVNTLRFKISQFSGDWAFYAALVGRGGEKIKVGRPK